MRILCEEILERKSNNTYSRHVSNSSILPYTLKLLIDNEFIAFDDGYGYLTESYISDKYIMYGIINYTIGFVKVCTKEKMLSDIKIQYYYEDNSIEYGLSSGEIINHNISVDTDEDYDSDNYIFCKSCGALKEKNTKCKYCS